MAILLIVSLFFLTISCGKNKESLTGISSPEIHEIHGIPFVSIPGGSYKMGSNDGDPDEQPIHTVYLDEFEMSVKLITNCLYCSYLNNVLDSGNIEATSNVVTGASGKYNAKEYIKLSGDLDEYNKCWISITNTTFNVAVGKDELPVVYVSWYGAKAFAKYYGWDLPTEAEWEYDALGGKQCKYGTDDGTLNSSNANYNLNLGHPTDTGSYPANTFGLYDMCGNVYEWCHDWYGNEYYDNSPDRNPTGPQYGVIRIVRGGCYNSPDYYCRLANRNYASPLSGYSNAGFRVVRRPGEMMY